MRNINEDSKVQLEWASNLEEEEFPNIAFDICRLG